MKKICSCRTYLKLLKRTWGPIWTSKFFMRTWTFNFKLRLLHSFFPIQCLFKSCVCCNSRVGCIGARLWCRGTNCMFQFGVVKPRICQFNAQVFFNREMNSFQKHEHKRWCHEQHAPLSIPVFIYRVHRQDLDHPCWSTPHNFLALPETRCWLLTRVGPSRILSLSTRICTEAECWLNKLAGPSPL